MRIRAAISTLVGLSAVSACVLAGGYIHADSQRDVDSSSSALLGSGWTVEGSTDYGTTWDIPLLANGDDASGAFSVEVDTGTLRYSPAYHALSLRMGTGSKVGADATIGAGTLLDGDRRAATAIAVRMVRSADGTCSSQAFDKADNPSMLETPSRHRGAPFDTPVADSGITLAPGTATTAGPPATVCVEVRLDRSAPATPSTARVGWPVSAQPTDRT